MLLEDLLDELLPLPPDDALFEDCDLPPPSSPLWPFATVGATRTKANANAVRIANRGFLEGANLVIARPMAIGYTPFFPSSTLGQRGTASSRGARRNSVSGNGSVTCSVQSSPRLVL